MSEDWIVIITMSGGEDKCERALHEAGYRVYVPRYRKKIQPHGADRKAKPVMRPVFEGYVFVHDWRGWPDGHQILKAGERMMMRPGNRPVELKNVDIEVIRRREIEGEFDQIETPRGKELKRTDIEAGDPVELELFGNRQAVLEELTDDGKAVVEMMWFGRQLSVKVKADDLEAV